jgi:hypothetical protein
MSERPHDPLLDRLAALDPVVPDQTRGASTKARCHAALARRRGRDEPAAARWRFETAAVGALAVVYLLAVIREALGMYGVL